MKNDIKSHVKARLAAAAVLLIIVTVLAIQEKCSTELETGNYIGGADEQKTNE